MVDKDVIKRLIIFFNQELNDLKKHQKISFKEYENKRTVQAEAERRFETTIQTAIDIGNHIIAQKDFRVPKTYREIFKILHENHIINSETSDKMQDFAGFRNILIHEYREIINKRVYSKLTKEIPCLEKYIIQIIKFLDLESDIL